MKSEIKDYQWPSSFANQNIKYNIQNEKKISYKLIGEIEGYFQTYYNYKRKTKISRR